LNAGAARRSWIAYRASRITPRPEDSSNVPLDNLTVLCPLNRLTYASPNAIVEHAARVHANTGPTVNVSAESVKAPPHVLQSTRVDSWPMAKVTVKFALAGFC
jgi:hypothetical protein